MPPLEIFLPLIKNIGALSLKLFAYVKGYQSFPFRISEKKKKEKKSKEEKRKERERKKKKNHQNFIFIRFLAKV